MGGGTTRSEDRSEVKRWTTVKGRLEGRRVAEGGGVFSEVGRDESDWRRSWEGRMDGVEEWLLIVAKKRR